MKISIIVPVKDDPRVEGVVEALRRELPPDAEILVADDGIPGTLPLLPGARIVPVHGGNPGRARNEAARVARGDLLLFTDADVLLPVGWIRTAVTIFEDPSVVAAQGNTLTRGKSRLARRVDEEYERFVESHAATGYADLCDTRCFGVRRQVFERFGFDSGEPFCEDSSLGRRFFEASVPIRFVPAWFVEHHLRSSISGELARFRRYAEASERHLRRTGRDLFRPPGTVPPRGPGASFLRLSRRFPVFAPSASRLLWALALALGMLSSVPLRSGRSLFSRARRAAVLSGRIGPRSGTRDPEGHGGRPPGTAVRAVK
jgi:glycosyltransferase involved in cell wall biosynthesis